VKLTDPIETYLLRGGSQRDIFHAGDARWAWHRCVTVTLRDKDNVSMRVRDSLIAAGRGEGTWQVTILAKRKEWANHREQQLKRGMPGRHVNVISRD